MMEKHSDLSPSGFLSFFAHLGQAKVKLNFYPYTIHMKINSYY
jgi:hypothetical protein